MKIPSVQFKKTLAVIAKPFNVGPIAFTAAGTAKTVKDYIDAPKERKQRVLVKDASMLLGSVVAFALVSPLSQFLCKTSFFEKLTKPVLKGISTVFKKSLTEGKFYNGTKKVMEHTEHVTNQAIAATINTLSGILGAVTANELLYKYVFPKKSFIKEKPVLAEQQPNIQEPSATEQPAVSKSEQPAENSKSAVSEEQPSLTPEEVQNQKRGYFKRTKVFENFDYATPKVVKDTSNRIWATVSDIPDMRVLSAPMIALTGFSVANTKGYENKLKKTSYELIANTFIPTAFVTAVSIAVEKKNGWIKYPALFAGLLAGAIVGHYTADKINKQINNKLECLK